MGSMLGIVFATEEEAYPFLKRYKRGRFDSLREGETMFDDDLVLCLTGIGKIKATLRTERMLQHHKPARLLHAGTCTALSERLQTGELVAVAQVFEGDRIELATPTYPRMPLETPFAGLAQGSLVTQDHLLKGSNEQGYWQRIADMSDMTGYAVAYVTATYGIPCHILKVVAGRMNQEDKQFRKTHATACETLAEFLVRELGRLA
jgi:nucleoside phosphorylase